MIRHNRDIQVLRAVAILLVLVHHARYTLHAELSPFWERFFAYFFGTSGVDLFLVISGFVVSRSFLASLAANPPRDAMKIFWIKRIYRILPAAWVWLGIVLALTLLVNKSGAFGSFRAAFEGAIAAILHVANVRLADCFGVYECGPTGVYWSLSLEEQFYILLPLLMLATGRLLPFILMLFIGFQILFPPLTLPDTFRATGLAMGVLLGWYSNTEGYRMFFIGAADRIKARLFFGLLCLCLAVTLHPALNIVSLRLGYQLVAIVAMMMVYMASMEHIDFFGTGRLRQLMCWIGDRSYSLYLSHMPAMYLSLETVSRLPPEVVMRVGQGTLLTVLSAFLAVVSAAISYRFLEQPFQRMGRQRLQRAQRPEALPPTGEPAPAAIPRPVQTADSTRYKPGIEAEASVP